MNTLETNLDSPAIKALASRFKLTQVFLRDDGFPIDDYKQVPSCPKHIRFKYDDDDDVNNDNGAKISSISSIETSEEIVVMEIGDYFQEMSSLGLPLSFRTSKQQCSVQTKGKHKAQCKDKDSQNRLMDQVLVPKLSEESQCYAEFQNKSSNSCSLSLPDQAELSSSGYGVSDDNVRLSNPCDGAKPVNMGGETGCDIENIPRNMTSEAPIHDLLRTDFQMENKVSTDAALNVLEKNSCCDGYMLDDCVEELPKDVDRIVIERVDSQGAELDNAMQVDDLGSTMFIEQTQVDGMPIDSEMAFDHDGSDIVSFSAVCGDWSAFWDSFYVRYYFYNTKTKESTWFPPPGMESFAYGDVSNVFNESNTEVVGTNVDTDFPQNEAQLDRHELVDKTRIGEQIGDIEQGARDVIIQALSSDPAMLSDTPCVNLCDHFALDGNHQDEITSSSVLTINHNQSPKDESEQEDSVFIGKFQSYFNDSVDSPCNLRSIGEFEAAACDNNIVNHVHMEELETEVNEFCVQDTPTGNRRKKKRKNRRKKKSFSFVDITKYWCQRYLLFSKFDNGIQMDEEGWFSVTPEAIASHHASRSGGGIVIDCFTGVGGNAIQFAKTSTHVIAIDIDPKKIDYAHHNAAIYGVDDRIDFINGDSFSVASKLKADTVFLSPPWGGPDYLKVKSYDINMLRPYDGQFLFNTFKATASLIIMFLPRNVDIDQLAELSLSSDVRWSLEVEKNFLNDKLKAVTAYFSKIC